MTMLWSTSAATILLICARTCSAIGPLVEPLKHVVDKECLFQPPAGRTLCLGGSEEGGTSVWGDQKTGRCLAHGNCTSWIRIRASDAKEGYPGQRIDVDLFWKASLATSSIEYAQDMIEFYFSPYAYGSKRNGLVVGIFIRPL